MRKSVTFASPRVVARMAVAIMALADVNSIVKRRQIASTAINVISLQHDRRFQ
jgi:hypothetical protein